MKKQLPWDGASFGAIRPSVSIWAILPFLMASLVACSSPAPVTAPPLEWSEVRLEALQPLSIKIPRDFVIDKRYGSDYLVFYIRPPEDKPDGTQGSLGVYTGYDPIPFCKDPGSGEKITIAGWEGAWSTCVSSENGLPIREVFPGSPFTQRIHLFLVGEDAELVSALLSVANSLKPAP